MVWVMIELWVMGKMFVVERFLRYFGVGVKVCVVGVGSSLGVNWSDWSGLEFEKKVFVGYKIGSFVIE